MVGGRWAPKFKDFGWYKYLTITLLVPLARLGPSSQRLWSSHRAVMMNANVVTFVNIRITVRALRGPRGGHQTHGDHLLSRASLVGLWALCLFRACCMKTWLITFYLMKWYLRRNMCKICVNSWEIDRWIKHFFLDWHHEKSPERIWRIMLSAG